MIPKIIHYCWFGRGKMPELAEHCLASWRKFLPDYELKLWNEDSFDVNRLRFTRQAYERRKFAFVTDYVRLYALKSFGGIYMDTDVEVLRSLDDLLGLPGFTGFESNCLLPTGLLASRKGAPWLDMLMSYYDGKPFLKACRARMAGVVRRLFSFADSPFVISGVPVRGRNVSGIRHPCMASA